MNRPLITHDDNNSYFHDNKTDNSRFNPYRWNNFWANNEERSSI